VRTGTGWLHLYTVDSRLRGFEMLVASSNNRAVENVSAEFPALDAVAADAKDLRYFTTLSNALLERKTWGLVATVLGNAANRSNFRRVFWWDDDVGLSRYLAAAAGTPQEIEVVDQTTGKKTTRPPRIVTEERAPRDPEEALKRWQQARKAFHAVLGRSETLLRNLEAVRSLNQRLPALAAAEVEARDRVHCAAASAGRATAELRDAENTLRAVQQQQAAALAHLQQVIAGRPGFLARLFRTSRFLAWREARKLASATVAQLTEATQRAAASVENLRRHLQEATSTRSAAEAEHRAATDKLGAATQAVGSMRARLGRHFVDDAFFQRDLGALMNAMSKRSLASGEKDALLPDLWASLFLVVPGSTGGEQDHAWRTTKSGARPRAAVPNRTARSRFTPPERSFLKPASLQAPSKPLNHRASNIRTKMAVVRLPRRKWAKRDKKRPEVGLSGSPGGSDKWPGMAAFCGVPAADQDRKKNVPTGGTGGGRGTVVQPSLGLFQ
jgi:hypothetical protein